MKTKEKDYYIWDHEEPAQSSPLIVQEKVNSPEEPAEEKISILRRSANLIVNFFIGLIFFLPILLCGEIISLFFGMMYISGDLSEYVYVFICERVIPGIVILLTFICAGWVAKAGWNSRINIVEGIASKL